MLNVLVLVPVRVRVCVLAFGFAPRMPRLITLLWSHPTSTSTFPSPSSFAFPLSFNLLPSLPSCHLAFVIAILSPLRCLSYDLQCNPCSGAPGPLHPYVFGQNRNFPFDSHRNMFFKQIMENPGRPVLCCVVSPLLFVCG